MKQKQDTATPGQVVGAFCTVMALALIAAVGAVVAARAVTGPPVIESYTLVAETVVRDVRSGEQVVLVTDHACFIVDRPHNRHVVVPTGVLVRIETDRYGRLEHCHRVPTDDSATDAQ